MNKRAFLKTSASLLSGGLLSSMTHAEPSPQARTNWSGNLEFHAAHLDLPSSASDVRRLVSTRPSLKALGAGHSFNSIADTTGDQVSLKNLQEMSIDSRAHTVTVGGGVKYGQLAPYLYQHGFALHNLASLPHVTVAGACSTATHGSGIHNGNLATGVADLEIVTASGETVSLSRERDPDRFPGAAVSLGALGIITRVTLDLLPKFDMAQVVFENLSFDQLEHHLDEIFSAGYSVSLFTDWQHHRATQVWIKSRLDPASPYLKAREFFGATAATRKLHPIAGHDAEPCTDQLGIPGPWYERLPHFRMNFTPSSGAELQTEYFVAREHAYPAILAVEKLKDEITPHLFITELRTIAADQLWMSPCHQRDSLTIHFTWKREWPAVKALLPRIEAQLAPFAPRPHWAKLFTLPPARIQSQYPRLGDFQALVRRFDPEGKFRNTFLATNVFGA